MTSFKILSFFLFICFSKIILCIENKSCSKNNKEKCKHDVENKYSKESNTKYAKYLKFYNEANQNYVPCDNNNCNCYTAAIKNDLAAFKSGISKDMIQNIKSKGTKYQIINHTLYREENCMFPARCAGIEHFLQELLPKLPDIEMIVNTRDWPQITKHYGVFGPVFSFSKTQEYHDIMYPAWAFWEGGPAISLYPRGIGRWDKHRVKLGHLGNASLWEDKIPKGFFRGSRTSSERDPLVLLSRENPEIIDAQYTKNQAWKSDADTLNAPPAKEVSFEDHCKYKYLFNFRGVAASFRLKHILLCKSLIFHVGNEWQEFFYPALKPWVHYIPVESYASKDQIFDLISFAMDHDDIAKKIAENGYNIIWQKLRLKDVSCYWLKLLKRYAKLLNFNPILDKNLIEIVN